MIWKFIKEKQSWLLFILFLLALNLVVAALDDTIAFTSVLYTVFLSLLFCLLYLFWRYQKETAFYKTLTERDDNLDLSGIAVPESPFEEIVAESLRQQTLLLKEELLTNTVALEQEKDDLLSWIHEVKTPMTTLRLLIDRIDDKEMRGNLTYEWLRIHHLLDQQLHSKRLPFMQNDLYVEKVSLEDILYDEIRTLQTWCIQKGIGFEVELSETAVLTDSKWLAFIIRQLLTNAVKYSEKADIVITSSRKDEQIILQIRDFGIGMEKKDLPRIFDKGFTSTANHQNQQATGMGLYLAKKAADTLHITMEVDSLPQKGTAFTLTFPRKNDFVHLLSNASM